jgi:outer membrane protein OmpA-like peptidoglycan-associated protein
MSDREKCMLLYAGGGSLGAGGIGTGVALSKQRPSHYLPWVVPVSVVGGALLGGVAGYFACPAEAAPPPPPPPPPLPPPPPPPPPPPVQQKIILRGVHFNFDKAVVRNADKPVLDEAAETLKANPNVKIYVNGYCDAIGAERYNLKLSQRRAEAVAAYLEDKGIPASQLVPQGFGKTHFVATNRTAEGRAQNRRVELVPVDQQ